MGLDIVSPVGGGFFLTVAFVAVGFMSAGPAAVLASALLGVPGMLAIGIGVALWARHATSTIWSA